MVISRKGLNKEIMEMQMLVILDKAAQHREYKRLKLGGGQAYGHAGEYTAVVS
jgi:hypothetical protein